jgi:hypothetical protein
MNLFFGPKDNSDPVLIDLLDDELRHLRLRISSERPNNFSKEFMRRSDDACVAGAKSPERPMSPHGSAPADSRGRLHHPTMPAPLSLHWNSACHGSERADASAVGHPAAIMPTGAPPLSFMLYGFECERRRTDLSMASFDTSTAAFQDEIQRIYLTLFAT